MDQGIVSIVGKGDLHESSMTAYGKKTVIDLSQQSPLSASDFTIIIYPSSAFYNHYITLLPIQLGIGLAVAVFIVLSTLYVVRTYSTKQQEKIRGEKRALKAIAS